MKAIATVNTEATRIILSTLYGPSAPEPKNRQLLIGIWCIPGSFNTHNINRIAFTDPCPPGFTRNERNRTTEKWLSLNWGGHVHHVPKHQSTFPAFHIEHQSQSSSLSQLISSCRVASHPLSWRSAVRNQGLSSRRPESHRHAAPYRVG